MGIIVGSTSEINERRNEVDKMRNGGKNSEIRTHYVGQNDFNLIM